MPHYIPAAEFASRAGLTTGRIRQLCRSGEIGRKDSRYTRVPRYLLSEADLRKILKKKSPDTQANSEKKSPDSEVST